MIKIRKLEFEIGERVQAYGWLGTVTGYINYNSAFFYIVVRDGSEEGREYKGYQLEKAA